MALKLWTYHARLRRRRHRHVYLYGPLSGTTLYYHLSFEHASRRCGRKGTGGARSSPRLGEAIGQANARSKRATRKQSANWRTAVIDGCGNRPPGPAIKDRRQEDGL